ncbi:hypothetical protein T09_9641 [Trichinella sp. T9]|nr:hypothetical protein T09_9641 [Trichinella sp. T9]
MLYLIFLSSKAQRILKQEGFNGTIVLDTLQSSAVISDVILNMKTISQSSNFGHELQFLTITSCEKE